MIAQFSFDPLIGHLTDATTPGQREPDCNCNEGVLHIPRTLGPEPDQQMQLSVISRILAILDLWMGPE